MVSLVSAEVDSFITEVVPSDVQLIVGQTIGTLAHALPAEFKVELHLDQADALMNTPDSTSIKSIVVSLFRDLLKTCTLSTLPLLEEVRTSCLQMCLYGLACSGGMFLDDSRPLAPELLDLASPEIIRHTRTEKDGACRVIGRFAEALVTLGHLSTILDAESRDLRLWLGRPGAVELANMITLLLSEVDCLFSNTAPLDVLYVIPGVLKALSPTLLAELDAELMNPIDETPSYIPESSGYDSLDSRSRKFMKYLWHCARAYNRLGTSVPLPSSVRIALANPEITRGYRTTWDINARVAGPCFGALIVNKLVDDFQSRASFSSGVYDAELACISSILDTRPGEILRWPNPSAVIKLLNVVSLMSGEIETVLTSGPTPPVSMSVLRTPVDMLNIIQQTINIISRDLILGGVFTHGDLPMDQVSLLRKICSKIANAQRENRFRDQTMGVLDQLQQISKQLPRVERKMRRCTSSIFGQQFVKGRSNLTTQPEHEVRRKRSTSI
ncbi:hypothetical protein H4582DRAFT_2132112 [Lactarius indigo]|nr:hypothetical protein H4582DRAFT_2132112 [Lactarius indigo]